MENKVDLIFKSIAEDVSKDVESAREYLKEEMPLYEKTRAELVSKLNSFISEQKLREGKVGQEKLQDRLKNFLEKIKGLSLDEILLMYPALPRTAFSKLGGEKLDSVEMDELLMDSAILGFLEGEDNDEVNDKQI